MARKIEVEVVGDTKSIEAAFRRTSRSAGTLERDLVRVGKKAALAVGALGIAAAGVGVKLVKMAGDAEEVRSKFKVTFQNEMPRMVKQLDAFSTATGASRYQLRQQAADLGALLVPLVGSRREAANLSVGFTKLATDLSSFNNVPVDEALIAIRAGLVGEAEPLRRFGVLLNEAAVKAEAYRSGIAKSGAALTEQQKVQARANLIMAQTSLAQGDATRTAGSFTNQWRKLQNQVSDTATTFGTKLLPAATAVLTKLNEWGPAIAQKVQPQLDKLSDWVSANQQDFRELFDNMKASALEAADALGEIGSGADKTAKAMGGWDQAFSMILTGLLASQFAKVGKSLTGAGGMLPVLTKLKGLGPTIAIAVVIDLAINAKHRQALRGWAELLADKAGLNDPRWIPVLGIFAGAPGTSAATTGRGTVADPRGATVGTSQVGGNAGGGVSLIGTAKSNPPRGHVIEFVRRVASVYGSPLTISSGFRAGARVKGTGALSQHGTGDAADIGPYTGATLTAIGQAALVAAGADPQEAYRTRSFVGTVNGVNILFNTMVGGNHFNHVHVGLRSLPAAEKGSKRTVSPSTTAATGGGGGGGTTTKAGGGSAAASAPLIPGGMRLALARAEGTKGIGDDLTALRAMVAYLQKLLPKTKDIEKRIEITEALNGLRERIADLSKTGKKTDISDAIDYEALKTKLRDQFREGIEQARQKIVDARAGFSAAFGILSDQLLTVFDAKTQQMLDNLRVRVAEFGFETAAGEETPAETELRLRRKARSDQALQDALKNAKTAEERADALAAIEDDALETRARAEREAADKTLALEAERIRKEREVTKNGFTKALADLQANWTKTNATTAQRTQELNDLMARYDMPFYDVGGLLGTSFADGFLDSMQIVFDRLADLARELNKVTPAQAAEAVILAGGSALAARSAALNAKYGLGSLPTFQRGGIVPGTGAQLAIVHGGETVVPKGAGMRGVTVNVYGDVTGTELIETVRREINRIQKRNGTTGYV